MKVLILAGGFATRLWPLTENRAKPLLLLGGKTILAHLLEKVNPDHDCYILTNTRFEEDFKKELQALGYNHVHIFLEDSQSDGEKMGAIKAVSECIKHFEIGESIMILSGDNLLPQLDLIDLEIKPTEAGLIVKSVKDKHEAQKFGVVEMDQDQVVGFEEKPQNPKTKLVSTGFMAVGDHLFGELHDYANLNPDSLGGIFTYFLEQGKNIKATEVEGDWFDVGSFDTYLEAHKKLNKGLLNAGGKIDKKSKISGSVFIGKGAQIQNSVIVDSIIYPGVRLSGCRFSHCIIDRDCHFQGVDLNHKLIRAGTRLHA